MLLLLPMNVIRVPRSLEKFDSNHQTSGQSNFTYGRIVDAHRQTETVQSYLPGSANMHPIGIRTVLVLSPAELFWTYWLQTCPSISCLPSWFCEILAWLSVWSKVQMICILSSWGHCHPIISCSSKIQNGLLVPFWCQLTQVVLEKRPLNKCSTSSRQKQTPKNSLS